MSGTGTEDFGDNRIEIDFSETVHIDGPIEVFLKGQLPFYSEPDITLVAAMLEFSGDIPDDRAEWHHNYTPIESWMSAHILRKVNGWTIQKTAERIRGERDMPQMLGFFEEEPKKGARGDPPSYTQLRDVWEETFTDRHRGAVTVIAERLVDYCRENGYPAPEDVFLPEEDIEVEEPTEDHPTVRDLTIEKTADVWEHARPMVLKHWYLKRHHNWQIPEANFFDGQTFPVMTDFPRIDWGQVDLRESYESYWVEPTGWRAYFGLEGGEEDSAYFLADAKATTYPVVQVEYQGETVHLEENLIHTPTD